MAGMGMQIHKLTALAVAAFGKSRQPGYYGDGGGLWLQVTPGGASWVFRYKVPHPERPGKFRLREMGLGSLNTIGLAAARDKARNARALRLDGRDPIAERQAARQAAQVAAAKAVTFKDCARHYIAAHRAGWKNRKHAAQWEATLETYVYPHFGNLPVPAVDTGLVLKALEPIWATKPETAARVRGRIEAVLDWATARGYRAAENPARWRGHLDNLLPKRAKVRRVEHHAALPYGEIGAFIAELRGQDGIAARALEFTILTAARTSEAIGARWSEINLAEALWTIPAERMKAGKEHRVPLSAPALAILARMAAIRCSDFVFPGAAAGRPLSNMALLMTLRRMARQNQKLGELTAHGFRSTFRDWAAERTNFPAEVAEMALAHVVADKVEAAYRRGDLYQKRRQIMDAWARFCAAPAAPAAVIPLRRQKLQN